MAYFNTCPHCGCNLDPQERCDCQEMEEAKAKEKRGFWEDVLKVSKNNGQVAFDFDYERKVV